MIMGRNNDWLEQVNPKEPYEHQTYPKAVYPPKVAVKSFDHELQLRAQWGTPLPYGADIDGKVHQESYAARQTYPKLMQPPHIEVNSPDEEKRLLASWRVSGPDPVEMAQFPQYRFHAEQDPVMVHSDADAAALGPGWFRTVKEVLAEERDRQALVKDVVPERQSNEETERAELFRVAAENFIKTNKNWSTEKLRKAVYGTDHPSQAVGVPTAEAAE